MAVARQKTLRALTIFSLCLGILLNGAMTETCLCPGPCSFGLKHETDAGESAPFHSHHTNTHCENCQIENGQAVEGPVSSTSTPNVKPPEKEQSVSASACWDLRGESHNGPANPVHGSKTTTFPPVYLQNLSIII